MSSRSAPRTSSCTPRDVGAAPNLDDEVGMVTLPEPGVGGEHRTRGKRAADAPTCVAKP